MLAGVDLAAAVDASKLTGRSVEQVNDVRPTWSGQSANGMRAAQRNAPIVFAKRGGVSICCAHPTTTVAGYKSATRPVLSPKRSSGTPMRSSIDR